MFPVMDCTVSKRTGKPMTAGNAVVTAIMIAIFFECWVIVAKAIAAEDLRRGRDNDQSDR